MNEQIVILDFGSQYTQVIARRIRECSVYSTILPFDAPAKEIAKLAPKGIILSGGPASVYEKGDPKPDRKVLAMGIPEAQEDLTAFSRPAQINASLELAWR